MPIIYIIDDDKDLLKVVKSLLMKRGFNVSTYTDWEIAAAAMKVHEPQLILLDVFLSGIDGLDVCQKFKASPFSRHIPVILFSAFPKFADSAINDYGADGFIEKPFEVNELISKVHEVLSKRNAVV